MLKERIINKIIKMTLIRKKVYSFMKDAPSAREYLNNLSIRQLVLQLIKEYNRK